MNNVIVEYKVVKDYQDMYHETNVVHDEHGTRRPVEQTVTGFVTIEYQIEELLKEGWQPYGNMTFDSANRRHQPMVKYGQPPVNRPSVGALTGRK